MQLPLGYDLLTYLVPFSTNFLIVVEGTDESPFISHSHVHFSACTVVLQIVDEKSVTWVWFGAVRVLVYHLNVYLL